MSSIDTLDPRIAVEQSTFGFHDQWNPSVVHGSTFLVQTAAKLSPIAAHWTRFVEGIFHQDSAESTGDKHGGTLAMDAYWDGHIRNRKKVLRALEATPKLNGLLVLAQSRLAAAFKDARLVLEGDPDGEQLYVVVETSLEVDRARALLSEFDQNWWLENMEDAKGNLSVVLDLV